MPPHHRHPQPPDGWTGGIGWDYQAAEMKAQRQQQIADAEAARRHNAAHQMGGLILGTSVVLIGVGAEAVANAERIVQPARVIMQAAGYALMGTGLLIQVAAWWKYRGR